jgi:hypothetical protein
LSSEALKPICNNPAMATPNGTEKYSVATLGSNTDG